MTTWRIALALLLVMLTAAPAFALVPRTVTAELGAATW